MSKKPLKYLKNEAIEDLTASRIREYEAKVGITVTLPVPVEQIVEQVLGLNLDWDEIEEQPGEQILGGLVAAERKIVLNEKHKVDDVVPSADLEKLSRTNRPSAP